MDDLSFRILRIYVSVLRWRRLALNCRLSCLEAVLYVYASTPQTDGIPSLNNITNSAATAVSAAGCWYSQRSCHWHRIHRTAATLPSGALRVQDSMHGQGAESGLIAEANRLQTSNRMPKGCSRARFIVRRRHLVCRVSSLPSFRLLFASDVGRAYPVRGNWKCVLALKREGIFPG